MEDLVVVGVEHPTHTRRLAAVAAEDGVVVALQIPTLLGAGKRQHGVRRKHLIRTPTVGEHRSVQALKPQIRTRRKVGEHQAGAHLLLGHRTPMPLLRTRALLVVLGQDGAVQRRLGEERRQSQHPLGTRVRPRRLTMGGPVQHRRRREVGARRAG